MHQIRPIPGEVCATLAIVKMRNESERDLPEFAKAFGCTPQQEEKKQDTGKKVSQRTQQREQKRFCDDRGDGYSIALQSTEILIVFIWRVQQHHLDVISALAQMDRVIQHDFIRPTYRSKQRALT